MNSVRYKATLAAYAACLLLCASFTPAKGQGTGLHLDYPNGGEIFYTTRDTSIVIRWSGVDDTAKVQLDLSSDGGFSWQILQDSATGLSFEWNIRGARVSSGYRVRVAQVRPPDPIDNIKYTKHGGPVYNAVWSPSGQRVASISAEPHIWDAATGGVDESTVLSGPRIVYKGLDWSADSLIIAAGGDDQIVRLYDVTTTQPLPNINTLGAVKACVFNPSSTELLVASDDLKARVYKLPSTVASATYTSNGDIEFVAWSPNGLRVLICGSDARVQNRAGGPPTLFTRHGVSVDAGAWSPDGHYICTIGGDASIRMWDAVTSVERWAILAVPDGVRSLTYSTDGSMVAVGGADSSLVIYNAVDGAVLHTINSHAGAVRMLAFSRDGRFLASASDDDFARVYDLTLQQRVRDFKHDRDVTTVRWSPDDGRILTASTDGTARIWQVRDVILEADTSDATFAIAPPPPAFARFVTTGDTLMIGDQTTITLRMEGAQFLDLADVDSVRFQLAYDASMLHLLSNSVPVLNARDSGNYKVLTIQTLPLPLADVQMMTLTLRGTLGADSLTSMFIPRVDLIGKGPGLIIERVTDSILVRGQCRTGDSVRLYNPQGSALQLMVQRNANTNTTISAMLAEAGTTTIEVYDMLGCLLWSDVATPDEESNRFVERTLTSTITGHRPLIVIVTTPTQRLGKLTLE